MTHLEFRLLSGRLPGRIHMKLSRFTCLGDLNFDLNTFLSNQIPARQADRDLSSCPAATSTSDDDP